MELTRFIEDNIGKPYIWGKTDCFMLICKYLNAGSNHYDKYKTLRGALSYYKKHADKLDEYIRSQGYYQVRNNFENDGDLVKVMGKPFNSWGVYYKGQILISNEKQGLILEDVKNFVDYKVYRR